MDCVSVGIDGSTRKIVTGAFVPRSVGALPRRKEAVLSRASPASLLPVSELSTSALNSTMTYSMSGIWDTQQRTDALVALGYEEPTFTASMGLATGQVPLIAFQAIRDGERVRGVIEQVDGDQWEVREVRGGEDEER